VVARRRTYPAVFALALVAAHGHVEAKALAFQQLGKVCRIGTHLFHFAEYVNALRGWGRGLRNAVGRWYVSREADDLALQAVKYQQRDGWSQGDLLRLAHPQAPSQQHDAVFRWMLAGADSLGEREVKRKVRGEDRVAKYGAVGALPKLIEAFERAKRASSQAEIVNLIAEHDLPREASAAMALVTAATEEEYHIIGFSNRFMPLYISPRMRLDDVVKRISDLPFEGTDCALPMIWAREHKLNVSRFFTYTDSETWAGNIHPAQALRQYRSEFVGDAKAGVVGMTSNGFTLADPNDRGMLDVVGFDTTVPAVIADFVRN